MIKRKSKITLSILAVLCLFYTTFSFATDINSTSVLEENTPNEETQTSAIDISQTITQDDVYLCEDKVVIDYSVDGNVYVMGNEVTITGKINGNLYAMANTLKLQRPSEEDSCYITGSAYLCGNQVYFDAICTDLYVACNNFTGSYDSYIDRDIRLSSAKAIFQGLVGRNAHLYSDELSLTSEEGNSALIHGNLNYSSKTELSLDNSIVKGETIFRPIIETSSDSENSHTIKDYIYDIIVSLVSTIVIYLLLLWLAPKFKETSNKYIGTKLLPAFGIGLLSLIMIPVICIILLITLIGIPLSVSLLLLYILLIMISFSIVVISISQFLKEKLNSANLGTDLLIVIGVNIVLYLLKQIPYVGGWISFIILLIGLGIIVMYLFTKSRKEDTQSIKITENKED